MSQPLQTFFERLLFPARQVPLPALRRALVIGAVSLVLVHLPLVAGYAAMQKLAWRQIVASGLFPAPDFYAAFPLQLPRLLLIALFSIDVATWMALLALLPLDKGQGNAFVEARRRGRRRWIIAHAPLYPVAAFMIGARMHGEALSLSGAGAAWFHGSTAAGTPSAALAWVHGEHAILASLGLALIVHLALLAGPVRPARWLRNVGVMTGLAAALAAVDLYLIVPLVDGGLVRTMRQAQDELVVSCPEAEELEASKRAGVAFDVFVRTVADSPALKHSPAAALPHSVTALPPLPLVSQSGLPVELATGALASDEERPGRELRITGDGFFEAWPTGTCANARVLKADRGLPWWRVREIVSGLAPGALQLAFRPAPIHRPRALPTRAPELHVTSSRAVPEGVPAIPLPLEFITAPSLPIEPLASGTLVRAGADRENPFRRKEATDPLWQDSLPMVVAPPLDRRGRTALVVYENTPWDDVLRAIAAASLAGAREVYIVDGA